MSSTTLEKVLIANRGEIACRVMRTAHHLGIETVAVYSEADRGARHVRTADQAVCIGPAPASESYLSIDAIIDAARRTGSDAIHPGYGFLSENAAFARACDDAGIVFVGPSAQAISLMGDKARAKRAMIDAGVTCVPGYQGDDQSDEALFREIDRIGFPLMIKAAAGGGGRGMRLVHDGSRLADAIASARSEAINAFGSGDLILERAIVRPRHVEIQVFGDRYGTIVHLGERDCSVQRRHQKVIEEAPCPVVTPELRAAMGAAAVTAARAVRYEGAGTVEFLLAEDQTFYFLEMNTRLQVEHPVTELVTGLDLVELQLRVAAGEPLGLSQDDVTLSGHAIEVRLYAEDPQNGFLPSTGTIRSWTDPSGPGIRIDSGVESGDEVSSFYDPMVAKIIASGATRDEARRRLARGLASSALVGPATNRDFLIDALRREQFVAGRATTAFIEDEYGDGGFTSSPTPEEWAMAAVIQHEVRMRSAIAESTGVDAELLNWSSTGSLASVAVFDRDGEPTHLSVTTSGPDSYRVTDDGREIDVSVLEIDPLRAFLQVGDRRRRTTYHAHGRELTLATDRIQFTVRDLAGGETTDDASGTGTVRAPMHGQVVEVAVGVGDVVSMGQRLAVLEAMKMQHEIVADVDGTVVGVHVDRHAQVATGDLIVQIEATSTRDAG